MKTITAVISLLILATSFSRAGNDASGPRQHLSMDSNWAFTRGDPVGAQNPAFDDKGWRWLDVPHDWSIEGPYARTNSTTGSGGYLPAGIGWYRKHFVTPAAFKDKQVSVQFDGVFMNADVYLNGHQVGHHPYGYTSFICDLTPFLVTPGKENVLAVRVDNSTQPNSRWYTGSGIYRHVRLVVTGPLHIGHWGTYVTTPKVTTHEAVVRIETTVENHSDREKTFSIQSDILGPDGRVAASLTTSKTAGMGTAQTVVQKIKIGRPQLWSPDSPTRYILRSRLQAGATVVDETTTAFGIRTAAFDPDQGFLLNGRPVKLKGVCLHHDAGCLGAAVPDKVLERRLRVLKELGVNAIRTSHNPPAPELLDLCDRLGLLVKDEAFDEFTPSKKKWVHGRNAGLPSRFGYAEIFEQWSVADIQDLVRRDRNHPCVILWSIGNEIDYANDPFTDPVLGADYQPGNPPGRSSPP
jgi:beta-galactosidase